jgi:hypothetical protein
MGLRKGFVYKGVNNKKRMNKDFCFRSRVCHNVAALILEKGCV